MNENQRHRVFGQVTAIGDGVIEFFFDDIPGVHTAPIIPEMPDWFKKKNAFFRAEVSGIALRKQDWSNLQWSNFKQSEYQDWTEQELLDAIAHELE